MTSHEEEQPLTRRRARELQSGSPESSTPDADGRVGTGAVNTGSINTESDEKQHEDEYRALVTSAIDLPGAQSDSGRILTRRELRALWAQQEAERNTGAQPRVDQDAPADAEPAAVSAAEPAVAEPTFDQLTFGEAEDTGEIDDDVVDAVVVDDAASVGESDVTEPEFFEPEPEFVEPEAVEIIEPEQVEPEPVAVEPEFVEPEPAADIVEPEPVIFEAPDVETSIDDVPDVIEASSAVPPVGRPQDVPTQAMPKILRQEDLPDVLSSTPVVSVPPAVEETIVEAVSADAVAPTTAFGTPVDDEPAPVETGSTEEPFWSERVREAKAPTDEPAFDELISRAVASAGPVTTTNALIMPTMPADGDFATPLTMTGEVMITGTFELPRSLSETGQHPRRYEAPDIDQMFDRPEVHEAPDDAVPVSAASAVSSHTTANGQLLTPPSKKGSRAPIALGITAGGLAAVLVAVAVVAGFMTGVL